MEIKGVNWYRSHDLSITEAQMDSVYMALMDWLEQNPPWDALNCDEQYAIERVWDFAKKLEYRLKVLDLWYVQ